MGVFGPETLFSRKWGFGALSGVGGIASSVLQIARSFRPSTGPDEPYPLNSGGAGSPP